MKSIKLWIVVILVISFDTSALFENELDKIYDNSAEMSNQQDFRPMESRSPFMDVGDDVDPIQSCCFSPPPGWTKPHPSDTAEDILKRKEAIKNMFEKNKKEFDRRMQGQELLKLVRRPVQPESIEKLIDQGADVDARDKEQKTPLHWAASEGRADNVKTLIHQGADIYARDYTGATPLHLVAKYFTPRAKERSEIIGMLIDEGASIYERNNNSETVLDVTPNYELQQFIRYRSLGVNK